MSENHCKDCCCARSWEALGITSYTGRSIPEEIQLLRAEVRALRDLIETELGMSPQVIDENLSCYGNAVSGRQESNG